MQHRSLYVRRASSPLDALLSRSLALAVCAVLLIALCALTACGGSTGEDDGITALSADPSPATGVLANNGLGEKKTILPVDCGGGITCR